VIPREDNPNAARVKGMRWRRVCVSDRLERLYGEYLWPLADLADTHGLPLDDDQPVFVNTGGTPLLAMMGANSVYRFTNRLHARLDGKVPAWTPHWFRHTHATALLLPRPKVCDRGNACLTCGEFATSESFTSELTDQRSATLKLIQTRKQQHQARTGREMTDDNIWLQARMSEIDALDLILAAIKDAPGTDATVQGAGSGGRPAARTAGKPRQAIPTPVNINTSRWRRR